MSAQPDSRAAAEICLIDDFTDEWGIALRSVSSLLLELESAGSEQQLRALFRHLHSMKSNLRMVEFEDYSQLLHAAEDCVSQIQAGLLPFLPEFADLLVVVLQRVGASSVQRMQEGEPADPALLRVANLLAEVGSQPQQAAILIKRASLALGAEHAMGAVAGPEGCDLEQEFFRQLSLLTEQRAARPAGATQRSQQIARQLNDLAGRPLDDEQLAVATALRDVGMALLPTRLLNCEDRLDDQQAVVLRQHPAISAGLLAALPHWSEAQIMVRQHHERFDGSGYPAGLAGDGIHLGARLLAIVDTFEAMTQRRPHRDSRRPILRVVAEVNALSGQQFDPFWVEVFNRWVRQTFVSPGK